MFQAQVRTLFVTWDAPGQTYLEALYVPILRAIATSDFAHSFEILQFTWGESEGVLRLPMDERFDPIPYHRMSVLAPSTVHGVSATVARGARMLSKLVREAAIDVVLARSLLPAAITSMARRRAKFGFCFDADGLMADERIEFGGWSHRSPQYWGLRVAEMAALFDAHSVLTRTEKAKEILIARAGAGLDAEKLLVVPNGKNPALFRPLSDSERLAIRAEWAVPAAAPWLLCVGSVGQQYLPDATLELQSAVLRRREDARFLWLTQTPDAARDVLRRSSAQHGAVATVSPGRVADILAAADVGLALRAATLSQRAVSPIKIGEYLLSGLAVVTTGGVGDLDTQLGNCDAVFRLEDVSRAALDRAAAWITEQVLSKREDVRERARAHGKREFSLERSAAGYREGIRRAYPSSI